jgi:hypothetical protein
MPSIPFLHSFVVSEGKRIVKAISTCLNILFDRHPMDTMILRKTSSVSGHSMYIPFRYSVEGDLYTHGTDTRTITTIEFERGRMKALFPFSLLFLSSLFPVAIAIIPDISKQFVINDKMLFPVDGSAVKPDHRIFGGLALMQQGKIIFSCCIFYAEVSAPQSLVFIIDHANHVFPAQHICQSTSIRGMIILSPYKSCCNGWINLVLYHQNLPMPVFLHKSFFNQRGKDVEFHTWREKLIGLHPFLADNFHREWGSSQRCSLERHAKTGIIFAPW